MRRPVPAAMSSPVPAVLVKPGPLDAGRGADLRPYFDAVPDPRSRRGRWYSPTAILLVCACAVVSGAKSVDGLAEWGRRASNELLAAIGIRRHLLGWRRAPSPATIGRVPGAGCRGPLTVTSWTRRWAPTLAGRHRVATEPAHRPWPSTPGRPHVITVDAADVGAYAVEEHPHRRGGA
ncbi:transposase family protein [Streptomyces erythrochromogenes]|uniref:transposase family protein n=1 Tax=Streptomyces erythrochromogenes TaxID=285574 RepID=UPI0034363529